MRVLLLANLACSAVLLAPPPAATASPQIVESIHKDSWRRFVQPNGLLLDYNSPVGEIELPTSEEAHNGKPNALSWGTPVENGAFFTGLYLDAQLKRWQLTRSDIDRDQSTRLARGLLLCATVPNIPGFVARNILPDGKSFYALGSDDQTAPWFYGLWRYVRSGAANKQEVQQVTRVMSDVADALHELKWVMPTASHGGLARGQRRGSIADPSYRGASRVLFIARAMAELTGDAKWRERYLALAGERLPNGATRIELVARGPVDEAAGGEKNEGQLWLLLGSQAMVLELVELESDPTVKRQYQASLASVARLAQDRLERRPDRGAPESSAFRWPSWRQMNELWKPQQTPGEAAALAGAQLKHWGNSQRRAEIIQLREPLSAITLAAIGSTAGPAREGAKRRLQELLESVRWERTYSSFGFLAEWSWYSLQRPAR